MRIAFVTVGCRLNQFETDALRGKAQAEAHRIVPFDDPFWGGHGTHLQRDTGFPLLAHYEFLKYNHS